MPTTTSHEDVAAGPQPLVVQSGRVTDRTVLLVASLGRLPRLPRRDDRQRRVPQHPGVLPGDLDQRAVLGPERLQHRVRGVPRAGRADGGPDRAAPGLRLGRRGLHGVLGAVRGGPDRRWLIAARAFQALGAAMLVPPRWAWSSQAFDPEHRTARRRPVGRIGGGGRRPRARPSAGCSSRSATGAGPSSINLPVGLLALLAARRQLVESRAPGRRTVPDLRGASLFALALALLTTGDRPGQRLGLDERRGRWLLLGSALALAGFVWSSRRHRSPLLDPALLRIRPFTVANVATVVAGVGFYAYLLVNILWLQYVWGYNVLQAGLALVPGALVAARRGRRAGTARRRRRLPPVHRPGRAGVGGGVRLVLHPDGARAGLPRGLAARPGAQRDRGRGRPAAPGSAALASVPGGRYATASAVVSSSRQIGGVLGIALLVVIIGTPAPATAADDLRPGWLFAAACFALCAAAAAAIGRIPEPRVEAADEGDAGASRDPAPAAGRAERWRWDRGAAAAGPPPGAGPIRAGGLGPAGHRCPRAAGSCARGTRRIRCTSSAAGGWRWSSTTRWCGSWVRVGHRRARAAHRGDAVGVHPGPARQHPRPRSPRSVFDSVVRADPEALLGAHGRARRAAAVAPGPAGRRGLPALGGGGAGTARGRARLGRRGGARRRAPARSDGGDPRPAGCRGGAARRTRPRSGGARRGSRPTATAGDSRCVRPTRWSWCPATSTRQPPPRWTCTGPTWSSLGPARCASGCASGPSCCSHGRSRTRSTRPLSGSLRPVAARIAGTSVGLVLAGGGARAFAHIGVLQVLAEAGVRVDRVAGCSLGSIIAGLHAAGHSPEEIQEVCYQEFVRRSPFSDYTLPTVSLAKGRRTGRAPSSGSSARC